MLRLKLLQRPGIWKRVVFYVAVFLVAQPLLWNGICRYLLVRPTSFANRLLVEVHRVTDLPASVACTQFGLGCSWSPNGLTLTDFAANILLNWAAWAIGLLGCVEVALRLRER